MMATTTTTTSTRPIITITHTHTNCKKSEQPTLSPSIAIVVIIQLSCWSSFQPMQSHPLIFSAYSTLKYNHRISSLLLPRPILHIAALETVFYVLILHTTIDGNRWKWIKHNHSKINWFLPFCHLQHSSTEEKFKGEDGGDESRIPCQWSSTNAWSICWIKTTCRM